MKRSGAVHNPAKRRASWLFAVLITLLLKQCGGPGGRRPHGGGSGAEPPIHVWRNGTARRRTTVVIIVAPASFLFSVWVGSVSDLGAIGTLAPRNRTTTTYGEEK